MSGRVRDFHLEPSRVHRESWMNMINASPSFSFDVRAYYGDPLASEVIEILRASDEARQHVISDMRAARWRLRNFKLQPNMREDREKAFTNDVMFCVSVLQFLRLAGANDEDILALNNCLSNNCTCDGCDLANGKRFRYLGGAGASSAP